MARTKGLEAAKAAASSAKASKYAVTEAELQNLRKEFPDYKWRLPEADETTLTMLPEEVCISLDHLTAGLTLPLPKGLLRFLKYFEMVPAMLTPNSITILIGINYFLKKMDASRTIDDVLALVTLISKVPGVFYCQARRSGSFGFTGYANAYHGWRDRIVFATALAKPWGFNTMGKVPEISRFKDWPETEAVRKLFINAGSTYIQLNVVTLEFGVVKPVKRKLLASGAEEELPREVRKKRRAEVEVPAHTAVASPVPKSFEEATASSSSTPSEEEEAAEDSTASGKVEKMEKEEESSGEEERSGDTPSVKSVPRATNSVSPQASVRALPPPRLLLGERSTAVDAEPGKTTAAPEVITISGSTPEGKKKGKEAADASQQASGGEASRDYWWNDKEGLLTTRYNASFRYIQDRVLSPTPAAMLTASYCTADRAEMEVLEEMDLSHLQVNLAFASAIVARHISERLHDQGLAMAAQTVALGKFTEERDGLQKRVAELEAEMAAAKAAHTKDKEILTLQVGLLEELGKDNAEKIASQAEELAEAGREKEELKVKIEALEAGRQEVAIQAGTSDGAIEEAAAQALAEFKASDAYLEQVSEYARDSFDTLKDALVCDGWMTRAVLDKYEFGAVMRRDGAGEFDHLPK